MNKLLMEENDRLQKQVSHLVYENGYFRQQHTQNVGDYIPVNHTIFYQLKHIINSNSGFVHMNIVTDYL